MARRDKTAISSRVVGSFQLPFYNLHLVSSPMISSNAVQNHVASGYETRSASMVFSLASDALELLM